MNCSTTGLRTAQRISSSQTQQSINKQLNPIAARNFSSLQSSNSMRSSTQTAVSMPNLMQHSTAVRHASFATTHAPHNLSLNSVRSNASASQLNNITSLRLSSVTPTLHLRHMHNPVLIRGRGRAPGTTKVERDAQERQRQFELAQQNDRVTLMQHATQLEKRELQSTVYSLHDGATSETVSLDAHLFDTQVRDDILHRVCVWQRACARVGPQHSKDRGEVSGTGRKPKPQKGGGARQGTRRAPHHKGGGAAHGPSHRLYDYTLPKKVRSLGLRCALSAKYQEGNLVVLKDGMLQSHKTSAIQQSLADNFGNPKSYLLLHASDDSDINANLVLATRSLPHCDKLPSKAANVLDILRHQTLFVTVSALAELTSRIERTELRRNAKLQFWTGQSGSGISSSEFAARLARGEITLPTMDSFPMLKRIASATDESAQSNEMTAESETSSSSSANQSDSVV